MTLPITIPTGKPEYPAMDYTFLRSEGIKLLERLSGTTWTDFNAHDPGITILEQICYAITDLAYRIGYDIRDILTSGGEKEPYRSLHSPASVLTTNPVTINDLRKYLLDVAGVRNAWMEPVETDDPVMVYDPTDNCIYLRPSAIQPSYRNPLSLRGLYRVLIEIDSSSNDSNISTDSIVNAVKSSLHACRSLAVDFLEPIILPVQKIVVNADIEVSATADPVLLLANIYSALSMAVSPRLQFYTLTEMLARGKGMDEIMNGPALNHGFIDADELESLQRKIGLRTSDLIQEILKVADVLSVSTITISDQEWYLKLEPDHTPVLDIANSAIRLMHAGVELRFDHSQAGKIMEGLNINNRSQSVMAISQLDIVLSAGKDRRIGQYYSIQNQFPAAYGIGAIGLPDSAAPQRKAQARQLKAYLMFFDQLLANYFAQLAHTKDLFSFYTEDSGTYFSQVIDDEHFSMDDIYGKGLDADRLVEITETTASESDEQAVGERKNRFLNHLLARFAEQFPDYLLQTDGKSLVQNKSAFLRDYPQIGAARGCGFDYTVQPGGKDNLSGLEKRISLKLDIPASISENSAGGGFYMVEHILLRPGLADVKTDQQESLFLAGPAGSDPYSNLVSFIFPDSELIRPNKTLIAKTLREETPAHIRMNIIYLKEGDMSTFESAYRTWLHNVTASDINRRNNREMIAARDRMAILLGMGIPYPSRDLRLTLDYANNIVPNNVSAKITLVGGQNDVRYQLCDVDGDPLVGSDGAFFETGPTDAATISLTTPVIKDDTTFKVLAIRENKEKTARMETYLDQSVAITVSINTSLPVYFTPPAGATASRKQQINVYYGGTVSVTVENTQVGFSYKLVSGTQDISSAINGNNGTIALVSSADKGFTQDTTINVLAYNTANPTVATNLKTKPSIKVIINTSLPVYFTPQGSDTSKKQQINVNYKSTVSVTVENTQVGFSYKLVSGTRDISSAINGNNGTITMVTLTEKGFTQDQTINVCAYITTTPTVAANLETNLIINVRPDPAVIVSCSSGFIVDYTGAATLTLASPQPNVTYSLYKRDAAITASDLTNNTDFTISAGYATRICFKIPTPITDWTNPAGFSFVGQFTLSTGNLSVSTGSRTEDTLFVIKATSTTNNLSQQLTMPAAIVVRPKVDLAINASKVSNSNTWNVTLASGVQKGVSYALRRNTDNTQVTASPTPQTQDNSTVTLSTGAITGTTATFNILATKSYQGVSVSAQLKQTVTINITPPNVVITPSN